MKTDTGRGEAFVKLLKLQDEAVNKGDDTVDELGSSLVETERCFARFSLAMAKANGLLPLQAAYELVQADQFLKKAIAAFDALEK